MLIQNIYDFEKNTHNSTTTELCLLGLPKRHKHTPSRFGVSGAGPALAAFRSSERLGELVHVLAEELHEDLQVGPDDRWLSMSTRMVSKSFFLVDQGQRVRIFRRRGEAACDGIVWENC